MKLKQIKGNDKNKAHVKYFQFTVKLYISPQNICIISNIHLNASFH